MVTRMRGMSIPWVVMAMPEEKKRGVGSAGSLRRWQDGDEFLVARGASGGSLRLLSGLSPPNALQAHTRRAKEPFPL